MLSSHFIKYALVCKTSPTLHLVEWGHGPVHCFGGVELTFDTTSQGAYWRPEAVAACQAIVAACGGIVAEDRGVVRLIVPPEWAVEAHAKLSAVCQARTGYYDGTANEMALVSAGVGKLVPTMDSQRKLRLGMEPVPCRTVFARSIEVSEGDDGRATVTVWTEAASVSVRVPMDWASSDKQRWHTIAKVTNDANSDFDKEADYDDPEDV